MNSPIFDADLLRRYGIQGPRYTSYPPATQFDESFDSDDFRAQALQATGDGRGLSLYVHIPYCFSPCFYCGCNRIITRDTSKGGAYVRRLSREIELVASLFNNRKLTQLHFGGGTPNFLDMADFAALMECIGTYFRFAEAAQRDFSIELDPRFIDAQTLERYAALGLNRVSLGVQDFDERVQLAVNRVQSLDDTLRVVHACRDAGFKSVNIDLIYGLPLQTLEGFGKTLDTVVAVKPERIAIYGYAHMPTLFKAQRQIRETDLPGPELKLSLLQLAIEKLCDAGYRYIGMDHFALPDDELAIAQQNGTLHRNFMGYTTHADTDLVGVGVSAISHIGNSFSQNARGLTEWELAIDAGRLPIWRGKTLDDDDRLRADLIQQLMCHGEIDYAAIERNHAIEFERYFTAELQRLSRLIDDGLVQVADRKIKATPRGRLLLRVIAMCFDRYMTQPARSAASQNPPRYSAAI